MKYYAGIGSRKTPTELKEQIHRIASRLENEGYILRSGGADGADKMFEEGIENKEIYLPWRAFNGNQSRLYRVDKPAIMLASEIHPAWNRLSHAAKLLMGRNSYQVLGEDLKTPADFIICYTSDGKASGGTGQAIRIAKRENIPVFNIHDKNAERDLWIHLGLATQNLF